MFRLKSKQFVPTLYAISFLFSVGAAIIWDFNELYEQKVQHLRYFPLDIRQVDYTRLEAFVELCEAGAESSASFTITDRTIEVFTQNCLVPEKELSRESMEMLDGSLMLIEPHVQNRRYFASESRYSYFMSAIIFTFFAIAGLFVFRK